MKIEEILIEKKCSFYILVSAQNTIKGALIR